MSRPRILHVKGSGGFGGDCVLMLELGLAAREHGFEVDILATAPRFQEMIRDAGLGIVDLDVIRREIRPLWDARGYLRLKVFLRSRPYSIVHTHTSKSGMVGRLAATRVGVPAIVHTPHLMPFHEETGRLTTPAYVAAERLAARWCDRIVTVSEFQRQWALRERIGSPEKVIAIPNGVPDQRATPTRSPEEVRAELGLGGSFVVLATGRLARQKGIEFLVSAAAQLPDEMPSTKILIAGDGPLAAQLARLVSDLGLDETVLLLGHRSDVGDLLAAADLVVLPSLWEGLSISLLEAMAAGKPVVTTTLGSNLEVTNEGETALLVPPKDSAGLAQAIHALANDAPRRELLGRRGLERQREWYTMRRMIDAYLEEYDRLLRLKTPHTPTRVLQVEGVS